MDSGSIPGNKGTLILVVASGIQPLSETLAYLKHNGFDIITVSDGSTALEEIRLNPAISTVLIEDSLPDSSGFEVCLEIRKQKNHFELPLLMLLTGNSPLVISGYFEAGASDVLRQPFKMEELLARLRALVVLRNSYELAIASEISFLRAQVKPHFLFNALTVIDSLVNRDPAEAKRLLETLSVYLRTCFDFENIRNLIPLEKVLEMVNAYVAIEKARFGNKLQFELQCSELPPVLVPRLVLQPLVENAIYRGIFKKSSPGIVNLKIWTDEEMVHFEVSDNGPAISEEQIAGLLDNTKPQKGVGKNNINQRLLKYYGSGLSIDSSEKHRTVVKFSIPNNRTNADD